MARNRYDQPDFQWPDGEAIVFCRDVIKNFKTAAGETTVLKGINASIYPGEFVSVVGRSGSGKSTLVNMITGIDHPTLGVVKVGGTELHRMNEGQVAVWRGKTMGIVFQFFQLLPMLTLVENIMLPMDFCNLYSPAEREERALRLLRRVGLEDMAHKLPGAVSGGQQQSAAVARALANDPPIIMADEPTGNLDSRTAEDVMQLFEELIDQGKTILMVTHDPVLAKRTSRTLIISDGELVSESIARAFPDQNHNHLLQLTHLGQQRTYTKDETLPGHPGEVYVVAKGQFDLVKDGQELVKVFENGAYLDPTELHIGRRSGLSLRAGKDGAEVLAFERGPAVHILGDAVKTPSLVEHPHQRNPFRGWLGWLRRPE
jgi:putative ABC transport system ATP-binding protein